MNQVEDVVGYRWDADQIRSDWYSAVLPHLTRNTIIPAVFAENPDEEMFTYVRRTKINPILEGTVFEDILTNLPFKLNRAVFIYIPEGFCLRHHIDPDDKYHISVVENPGSFYYDYDRRTGVHLPADGQLRKINSSECHHTAVNGGVEPRIHLVMTEHECEDESPKELFVSKLTYDYSACSCLELFTGKRDIASTIEQNFTMPLTQAMYRTKKVHKLRAYNEPNARTYEIYWSDRQTMTDAIRSDMYWQTEEALKEFGVTMSHTIL